MKKTITTCDFCGKRVERGPMDFYPMVTIKVSYNPADLIYRSKGHEQTMDCCNTCSDLVLRFVYETIGEKRFEGKEEDI